MSTQEKPDSTPEAPPSRHRKQVHAPEPLQLPGKLPTKKTKTVLDPQAMRQAAEGIIFAITVLIIVVYGTRLFFRGTETARRKVCQNNLRVLHSALLMFAQDHEGRLPPPGEDIVRQLFDYVSQGEVIFCPSDDLARPWRRPLSRKKRKREPIRQVMSYAYRPPSDLMLDTQGDASEFRIMWDRYGGVRLGAHNDGGNVLYLDGHVRWRPLARWSAADQPW